MKNNEMKDTEMIDKLREAHADRERRLTVLRNVISGGVPKADRSRMIAQMVVLSSAVLLGERAMETEIIVNKETDEPDYMSFMTCQIHAVADFLSDNIEPLVARLADVSEKRDALGTIKPPRSQAWDSVLRR